MLRKNSLKCPTDKEPLHWHQFGGMRLRREIIPPKPKHPYYVYDAQCPKCRQFFEVKASREQL